MNKRLPLITSVLAGDAKAGCVASAKTSFGKT